MRVKNLIIALLAMTLISNAAATESPTAQPAPDQSDGGTFFAGISPKAKNHKVGSKQPVLGLQFTVKQDSSMTALKFYKADSETGEHTFTIWQDSSIISTISTPASEGAGWKTFILPTALQLKANATYTISFQANSAYAATPDYSWPVTKPSATALKGVYSFKKDQQPVKSFKNLNYFIDINLAE